MFLSTARLLYSLLRKCENAVNLLSNKSALALECHYRYAGSMNNTNSNGSSNSHDMKAECHQINRNCSVNDNDSCSCNTNKINGAIDKWSIRRKCHVEEQYSEENDINTSNDNVKDDHNEREKCASMRRVVTEREYDGVNKSYSIEVKAMHNYTSCNTSHYKEEASEETLPSTYHNTHSNTTEKHGNIIDLNTEKEFISKQSNVQEKEPKWKERSNLHEEEMPRKELSQEAMEQSRYHKEQQKHSEKESEEHNNQSQPQIQKEYSEKESTLNEESINFTSESQYDEMYKPLQDKKTEEATMNFEKQQQQKEEQLLHKQKWIWEQQHKNEWNCEQSSIDKSKLDVDSSVQHQTGKKPNHRYHHTSKVSTITLNKEGSASYEAESNTETQPRPIQDKLHRAKLSFDMLTNEPPQSKFSFLAHPDEADTFKFIVHDIVPNNTPKPLLPMWSSSLTSPALGKVQLAQHNWVSSDSMGVIEDQELIDHFVKWVSLCVPVHSPLPRELRNNVIFHLRRSSCRGLYARHAFRKGDVIFTIPLTTKNMKTSEEEMQNTHLTHFNKNEHWELSQEENSINVNSGKNDVQECSKEYEHTVIAKHKNSLIDEENKVTTTDITSSIDVSDDEIAEGTGNYNITNNVTEVQDARKHTLECACNSLLLNTETLSSFWPEPHKQQQELWLKQEHIEQNSAERERQEHMKEEQHEEEMEHQSKHFLPSYRFLFNLLMEHDSMTGHMDSNLLEMLNLTMHPLFIEQIYLAMQLACERHAQGASPFYPYLALLSYADDHQLHHYTDDEEIVNLHRDVIGIRELLKYHEEATRWRYVLAKVHHAWVREYKRQKHNKKNNDVNNINKKSDEKHIVCNNEISNNDSVMTSTVNKKTLQIHEANNIENTKSLVHKSKAFVDKLKNNAVYERWWKQRESYKPQNTEDLNSLVSNASASLLNKIANYSWFNHHAAEPLITSDNTEISNNKIVDNNNNNNKNVMRNTNENESMTHQTISNKQIASKGKNINECNQRNIEIEGQTLPIHAQELKQHEHEEWEENEYEMEQQPIDAPPSLSDLTWAFRTVLARHRVLCHLRSNTHSEIAELNTSLNYDMEQKEKVDFFARNVMKLKWTFYEKVLGVMNANSLHVNDVDAATMPTLIPLIDMLSHDHRGRGNTYMTIEEEKKEEDDEPCNMISKLHSPSSDANNKVKNVDGSTTRNSNSTSKVLVLRAAEDIEEFDEFTTVFPSCESPVFALYRYGFVTSYNETDAESNNSNNNSTSSESSNANYNLTSSGFIMNSTMEVEMQERKEKKRFSAS